MRKLLTAVAIVGLFLGASFTFNSDTASAHNYDDYSLWACAATRPYSYWYVAHSYPDWLTPDYARYKCRARTNYGNGDVEYWAVWWFEDNVITRPWAYQDCHEVNCSDPNW